MYKELTKVGNSRAVIIPKKMIDRFAIESYSLEEVENGILIVPARIENSFQQKLNQLKTNKKQINDQMIKEAEEEETISYYQNDVLGDIDLDIQ